MQRDTVTLTEAAALTGVSADTVKRRIKAGELHAVKVGKAYKINKTDLGTRSALDDLVADALRGVSEQLQQLTLRIEQRDRAMANIAKTITAMTTKAASQ